MVWAEDPSNADPRFFRVRARAAAVWPIWASMSGLCATADRMRVARAALDAATADALTRLADVDAAGDVRIAAAGWPRCPGNCGSAWPRGRSCGCRAPSTARAGRRCRHFWKGAGRWQAASGPRPARPSASRANPPP
ncbi:MAG: hypothetical protein JKP98_20635 [Rhodobacteraceae bacterium]|nr:hypothetical protein [Paracoccaceae bacterium]